VLDQESRANKQEAVQRDRLQQLERMIQCQTEKLECLEALVNKLVAANSSQKLNDQSATNDVTDRQPPAPAPHHSEDYCTSRDLTRANTLVEEFQCPKNLDTQS
jgi:hypothetical protein